jgi:Tol biopolymer transport system component
MDEQRLERALRHGPPFAVGYVPSSVVLEQPVVRPPVSVGRLVLTMAVTGALIVGLLAGLAALGAFRNEDGPITNGWVAFVAQGDIHLVREGQAARRIIGAAADDVERDCPAFAPDGARLAHGEAAGTPYTSYQGAALVISDIDAAGSASESRRIDVGGAFPPPCAVWSADGRRVAFGVPLTSPINPDRSAAGSEVWVATVADGHVDVLSDLLATDLEWSPDGSVLAIASGQTDLVFGQSLRDGSIHLYDADSGDMRTLVGPSGVSTLTWSPDGRRIAYQRGASDGGLMDQQLWVVEVDGRGERQVAGGFGAIRGIGPVWSPTGDRIVYQKMKGSGEAHWVVLVTPDGESEVVLPDLELPVDRGLPGDGAPAPWRPDSVSWSPDGEALLYSAWVSGRPGRALIVRPLDGSDPILLQDGGGRGSWGRLPEGEPG